MILFKYLPLIWSDDLPDSEKKLNLSRCECIKNNLFWFPSPKMLNDPYDCKPFFKRNKGLKDIKLILGELDDKELEFVLKKYPNCRSRDDIVKLHQRISRSKGTDKSTKFLVEYFFQILAYSIVNIKMSNVGILSLTTDYANCQMWAHYAKNHEGICIEIDMPQDTKGLRKVIYTSRQPSLMIYEATNEKYGKLIDMFYKKSRHWVNESEWRIVAYSGNEKKTIPGARVTRIIYGLNTSEVTKRKIEETVGQGIQSYQIKMKRNYLLK
jgi:hypothetical protein